MTRKKFTIRKAHPALLIGLSVVLSVVLTNAISSVMSIIFHGRITIDYLITGTVASIFCASLIVTILIYFIQGLNTAEKKLMEVQAKADLAAREQWFRILIENTTDLILQLDETGKIRYASPSMTRLLGYPSQERLNTKFFDLIHDDDATAATEGFEDLSGRPQGVFTFVCRLRHRDGTWRWIEATAQNLLKTVGIHSIVVNGRDISERKKTEDEIRGYTEQLKDSNRELEQFAYITSHDLQEPLRIITLYLQLLAKKYQGAIDRQAEQYISYTVASATRLQEMIKALLIYSRIGKEALPLEEADTSEICQHAITNLALVIREKNAQVTFENLPKVWMSKAYLMQVFQNLINNAIKYCEGSPRIHICAERKKDEWVFAVADNGIGIDPQYYERIFQIFQRLQPQSEYPGTGIGLAVCKKIVEKYGGRLWVESNVGEGSRFFFSLPARKGS